MGVKKKRSSRSKTEHKALVSRNIGSNADGTPKIVITAGETLKLTKKQVDSYRQNKIIL